MTLADLEALVARAGDGDGPAFVELVRSTQADVRRACAAWVDAATADDLAQETYIRVHRGLRSYDGRATARTWLLGIARNVCRDELRARTRRRRREAAAALDPSLPDATGAVDLWACVRALPEERRDAFLLTQLLGFSYQEAAAVCRCPVGTVRSRVARARDDLRQMIGTGGQDAGRVAGT